MMLYHAMLAFCLISSSYCDVTLNQTFTFLNSLYMQQGISGCGTPIKCDFNRSYGGLEASRFTDPGYPCCYDCEGCTGDRCYKGWQCCNTDDQSDTFVVDRLWQYRGVPEDFVTCQHTFAYQKRRHFNTTSIFQYFFKDTIKYTENLNEEYEDIGFYYPMISRCQFSGSIIDALATDHCENTTGLTRVIDIIPFISLKTFQIFKNRFCAECNYRNLDEEMVSLPLFLSTASSRVSARYSFLSMFETVQDLVDFSVSGLALGDNEESIELIALPEHILPNDNAGKAILHTPCFPNATKISNNTCDSISNDQVLNDACDLFFFPINVGKKDATPDKVRKNLACAVCEFGSELQTYHSAVDSDINQSTQCDANMLPKSKIIINFQPAVLFEKKFRYTKVYQPELVLDISLPKLSKNATVRGYFLEPFQDIYRKILCPRRYFIHLGKCEPLFRNTIEHSYYVKIKMSRKTGYIKPFINDIYDIQKKITRVINMLSGFDICDIAVSAKKKFTIRAIQYLLFEIWLTPKRAPLYQDVLRDIEFIFTDSLNEVLHDNAVIPADIIFEPGDMTYIAALSENTPDIYDADEGSLLFPVTPETKPASTRGLTCGGVITLSKLDYCYRVRLDEDEVLYLNKSKNNVVEIKVLHIMQANVNVYADNFEYLDDGSVRVCIDDYIGEKWRNPHYDDHPHEYDDMVEDKHKKDINDGVLPLPTIPMDTGITIGLSVIVFIVIVSLIYCRINTGRWRLKCSP